MNDVFIFLNVLFLNVFSFSNNAVWYMNCLYKGDRPYVSGTSVALIRVSGQYLPSIYCIFCQINIFEFEFESSYCGLPSGDIGKEMAWPAGDTKLHPNRGTVWDLCRFHHSVILQSPGNWFLCYLIRQITRNYNHLDGGHREGRSHRKMAVPGTAYDHGGNPWKLRNRVII